MFYSKQCTYTSCQRGNIGIIVKNYINSGFQKTISLILEFQIVKTALFLVHRQKDLVINLKCNVVFFH